MEDRLATEGGPREDIGHPGMASPLVDTDLPEDTVNPLADKDLRDTASPLKDTYSLLEDTVNLLAGMDPRDMANHLKDMDPRDMANRLKDMDPQATASPLKARYLPDTVNPPEVTDPATASRPKATGPLGTAAATASPLVEATEGDTLAVGVAAEAAMGAAGRSSSSSPSTAREATARVAITGAIGAVG